MSGTFVAISDIHLDPFYGLQTKDIDHLIDEAEPSAWASYLDAHSTTVPMKPTDGIDSNYALFKKVVTQVKATASDADFVIYPGDFLVHGWWHTYGLSPERLATATRKTIEFVLLELKAACGGAPVFVTFGNDDSYTDDYALEASGAMLKDLEPACTAALGLTAAEATAFKTEFCVSGSYSAKLPGLNHRLVSISNVFWTASHRRAALYQRNPTRYPHPAKAQQADGDHVVAWLTSQLASATKAGETVWLLMHIPPGNATYTASLPPNYGDGWETAYRNAIRDAVDNGLEIDVAFAGHTHMDDYRFVTGKNAKGDWSVMHKIVPAVSPKFGQQSAYQQYTTDNGQITDWTTHYLEEDAANSLSWKQYTAGDSTQYSYKDPQQLLASILATRGDRTASRTYRDDYGVQRYRKHVPYHDLDRYLDALTVATHEPAPSVPTSLDVEEAMAIEQAERANEQEPTDR